MALTQVSSGLIDSTAQYNGFKNRIINGAMMIDQRNAGASGTPSNGAYWLDRWINYNGGGKFSSQQNQGSVTPPAGFTKYLGITSLSSYSVVNGDIYSVMQRIEGQNVGDLGWGTANAVAVTLSFWVRSSLTGTFGGSIVSGAEDRAYPFTYTISSADTWTQISISIPATTSGTWATTNGLWGTVVFGLGVGGTNSGTANTWSSGAYYSATGATSVVGTSGATFYITGVQLEKGSTATSFDYRPYGTELALCQRYYYQLTYSASTQILGAGTCNATTDARCVFNMPVTMRAAPTGILSSGTNYYSVDKPGTGFVNFNSMSIAYQSPSYVLLYASSISGMTTGYSIVMYMVASGASIGLSAEL